MQVDIQTYKDLGQTLHHVRNSLQLELRDVAQRLHIRAKYLAALEEGDLDVIPGKVYARGYLRQYAEFLGLNPDETAAAFDRVATARNVKYFVPEPTSRAYQPGFVVVVVALVGLFIAYMYWYRTHKAMELPPSHELVSPVPERLLAPVVEDDVAISPDEEPASEALPSDVLEEHPAYDASSLPVPGEETVPAVSATPPAAPTAAPAPASAPASTPEAASAPAKPAVPATTAPARKTIDASKTLPWQRQGGQ